MVWIEFNLDYLNHGNLNSRALIFLRDISKHVELFGLTEYQILLHMMKQENVYTVEVYINDILFRKFTLELGSTYSIFYFEEGYELRETEQIFAIEWCCRQI